MKTIILFFGCLIAAARGDGVVSDEFLAKVRKIESSNNGNAVGDKGDALGYYQFHRLTWSHVNRMRYEVNLQQFDYKTGAKDLAISTSYARDYFNWLRAQLKRHKIVPTDKRLYACFNAGLSKVVEAKGDLRKINSLTQRKCKLLDEKL